MLHNSLLILNGGLANISTNDLLGGASVIPSISERVIGILCIAILIQMLLYTVVYVKTRKTNIISVGSLCISLFLSVASMFTLSNVFTLLDDKDLLEYLAHPNIYIGFSKISMFATPIFLVLSCLLYTHSLKSYSKQDTSKVTHLKNIGVCLDVYSFIIAIVFILSLVTSVA